MTEEFVSFVIGENLCSAFDEEKQKKKSLASCSIPPMGSGSIKLSFYGSYLSRLIMFVLVKVEPQKMSKHFLTSFNTIFQRFKPEISDSVEKSLYYLIHTSWVEAHFISASKCCIFALIST